MKKKEDRKSAEKEENLGEKLRRGVLVMVGKRGGPTTPVLSWSLFNSIPNQSDHHHHHHQHHHPPLSARKLAAGLWELLHYSQMPPAPTHDDASPSSYDQPESATSLKRHIAASLTRRHHQYEKDNHVQPVSPSSYGSSLEVAPYRPAITPTSSLDFKGRVGGSRHCLKTSTELLRILNRIWTLEEQHASSTRLIKALKTELDNARARIKELLQDQRADRRKIDDLMKQIAEDKVIRKNQKQDQIHAAVQSVRDELEDERALRKRSESLHRKLVRELSELKSSLSDTFRDIERERKSRILLEDLCDEFANGIISYEQEVHALKQKSNKDWAEGDGHDRLILHLSESWVDERMQMKLEEAESGFAGRSSIVEKLGFEIESSLHAKRREISKSMDKLSTRNRRASMESVPLDEAVIAPQDLGDDEDSAGSDTNCFELNGASNNNLESYKDEVADLPTDKSAVKPANKGGSHGRVKSHSPSSLQVRFEEQMAWAMSCNSNRKKSKEVANAEEGITEDGNPDEQREANEDASFKKIKHKDLYGSSSSHLADNLIRSQLSGMEVGSSRVIKHIGEASCSSSAWRTPTSPVRQWDTKFTSRDVGKSESSELMPGLKENTLKAKLLEARSKGHRARTKASKVSSWILEG